MNTTPATTTPTGDSASPQLPALWWRSLCVWALALLPIVPLGLFWLWPPQKDNPGISGFLTLVLAKSRLSIPQVLALVSLAAHVGVGVLGTLNLRRLQRIRPTQPWLPLRRSARRFRQAHAVANWAGLSFALLWEACLWAAMLW